MSQKGSPLFTTKNGYEFKGISLETTSKIRSSLFESLKISPTHVTEASSYSLAMVARYALGLSADQADVCVLANQGLTGAIALATVRHLFNAGCKSKVFVLKGEPTIPAFEIENAIARAMGIEIELIDENQLEGAELEKISEACASSHNLIMGLFEAGKKADFTKLIELLNEARTPVHCVDCPLGVDPDTGRASANPLFASSTMSLGTVFNGLYEGSTYVGRHYLCDISLTKSLYKTAGLELAPIFSEQPVVQIFPKKEEETEDRL